MKGGGGAMDGGGSVVTSRQWRCWCGSWENEHGCPSVKGNVRVGESYGRCGNSCLLSLYIHISIISTKKSKGKWSRMKVVCSLSKMMSTTLVVHTLINHVRHLSMLMDVNMRKTSSLTPAFSETHVLCTICWVNSIHSIPQTPEYMQSDPLENRSHDFFTMCRDLLIFLCTHSPFVQDQ